MFVLPFLIWRPVFLPMKIEANWLLSSSAHSLLMSPVFCLLTHLPATLHWSMCIWKQMAEMESHSFPLSLFRLPHTVIFSSHLVYPTQPSIHWAKNMGIFLDSFLSLTSPMEPISCQYHLLFISQILPVLPISTAITVSAPFCSLLSLALPSPPATTFHTITTSLMSCPFLRGFMATICLQEKVQRKA